MIIPSLWTIFKVPDPIPFSVKNIPTASWPKGQHSWDKVPLVLISHLGTARAQRCHRSTGACTLCTDQTTFSRVNCAPPVSQHTPLSQGFSSKMATRLANSGGAPTILCTHTHFFSFLYPVLPSHPSFTFVATVNNCSKISRSFGDKFGS